MDLSKLTGEVIYKYGSYIFIFYVATFLVRKMWGLFEGKLTNIDNNVTENKKLNKDIAVILAQTAKNLEKHEKTSGDAQVKIIAGIDKLCDNLNGGNPTIVEVKKKLKEIEGRIK